MDSDKVRQHKRMAMGENVGADEGFESLDGKAHQHIDADNGSHNRQLGDGDRAARGPIEHTKGKLPATAHSDHGPHHSY